MNTVMKVTRNSHITHLSKSMPLIMMMFVAQIYIIKQAYPKEDIGNYSIFCAISICTYIATLFYYNKTIVTEIYIDRVVTHTLFGKRIELDIKDIVKVIGPKSQVNFSTIVLCTENKVIPLRFIDRPVEVQEKILQLKAKEEFKQAA